MHHHRCVSRPNGPSYVCQSIEPMHRIVSSAMQRQSRERETSNRSVCMHGRWSSLYIPQHHFVYFVNCPPSSIQQSRSAPLPPRQICFPSISCICYYHIILYTSLRAFDSFFSLLYGRFLCDTMRLTSVCDSPMYGRACGRQTSITFLCLPPMQWSSIDTCIDPSICSHAMRFDSVLAVSHTARLPGSQCTTSRIYLVTLPQNCQLHIRECAR